MRLYEQIHYSAAPSSIVWESREMLGNQKRFGRLDANFEFVSNRDRSACTVGRAPSVLGEKFGGL